MSEILVELVGGVARVTLNRPELRNAFNDDVIVQLRSAFEQINADASLRCVLLAANGPAFCAGADLNWMRRMAGNSWADNQKDAGGLADLLWTIDQCPIPVVGKVQGDCYAGGMGLASMCDVLVASSHVQFCLSEAKLGLLPATISPYVIRAMGEQAARRYFVTAERFSATQAAAMGMVHAVCEPAELDSTVAQIVQSILANGPAATRACKRLVRNVAGQPISAELRADTARRIADIRASDEGKEGLDAFLNKRKPNWLL